MDSQQLITGWPKDAFPSVANLADSIASHKSVRELYIGRGVDLAQRKSYHQSDNIVPIYYTESIDSAIAVESALIEKFFNHPKCRNKALHGGGGTTEEYGSFIYMALWL